MQPPPRNGPTGTNVPFELLIARELEASDPGHQMLPQATLGDVDFITGDYLAEHVDIMAAGQHPRHDPYAWDGIKQSINVIWEKRVKGHFQ
ncbi:hypothetical protein AJ79_01419 [Helicocarpus griseus UAMH5409]|uniref:Uncharacterized protein n=1 Tax=Helicocarpus griseus UAMH5409 TaxID=1447875 RepID=A0A2B7Y734_9EURO|nr:hypothetical protein AJ79_01419 [Helicocarpus griseus UAMH5409]